MKLVTRPGHTNATVTRRTAPFGIVRLHALHLALLVAAMSTRNLWGRVLSE